MSTTNFNENVSFIQHSLPGLDAGEYELIVGQQVFEADQVTAISEAYNRTYNFAVSGDRFSISNPAVVNSVFPPMNGSGEFATVLPHVVFSQLTYPWIRSIGATANTQGLPPGQDVDTDVATWLWVMLLDANDTGVMLQPVSGTIADLSTPPAGYYSYFNLPGTAPLGLEPGQSDTGAVQYIDVPLDLFWKLAPCANDLELMAHCRTVSADTPADAANGTPEMPTGTYSIVFGNRLPEDNMTSCAYLVSLEGLNSFLPASDGSAPAIPSVSGTTMLRLAVLNNWSFSSNGSTATFVSALTNLNNAGKDAAYLNVADKYTGNDPVIQNALTMGYVPLNATMRSGENTVSWYRGPLAPYKVPVSDPQQPLPGPIPSSDAATLFDPTTGLFDISYSAAWTLGRMIALQQKTFSIALYNWKKKLNQDIAVSVERTLIRQNLVGPVNLPGSANSESKDSTLLKKVLLSFASPQQDNDK